MSGAHSDAFGINNRGDVVGISSGGSLDGVRATLWTDEEIIDLTSVLDLTGAGWIIQYAYGINDAGQIIASGRDSEGRAHGFLPTPNVAPVPLPAAFLLLGGALSLLGFFCWRRKRMAVAHQL